MLRSEIVGRNLREFRSSITRAYFYAGEQATMNVACGRSIVTEMALVFKGIAIFIMCLLMQTASVSAIKPNIIIIMTDDMGYSDLGCFGSEIETPHIDSLAAHGMRFSQFYNFGKCCPTRAGLMTGLYNHQAGVGNMMKDEGYPGYRGRLNQHCVTIAEVLKDVGYRTIQTGKWHLGATQKAWWPSKRGFDNHYGTPLGGGFYFRPSEFNAYREVVRNETVLYTPDIDPPKEWYTTDAYTDEGLAFVRESVQDGKPFFWYLAFNAPHWPIKAKPEDIAKYRGKYRVGWDEIRRQRHARLVQSGLIDSHWELSPRDDDIPAWDSLSEDQKDEQDHIMATYAAAIDCVDQNVGKIIQALKALKQFENTLILFLCDNGGSAESSNIGMNKGDGEIGSAESFVYYGKSWATVSGTPFRKFKSYLHEGGVSTPLVAHWPTGIKKSRQGSICHEPAHVIDLMPTCLAMSGAVYPTTYGGEAIYPMEGVSLLPAFEGQDMPRKSPLFAEHQGYRSVRRGKWKLVAAKSAEWELYDMHADRTELNNVAKAHPEVVQEMAALYDEWAERSFVIKNRK
jgi:arylsulfatase